MQPQTDLVEEVGVLRGRQEVCRLPALFHGLEQRRDLWDVPSQPLSANGPGTHANLT